MPENFDADLTLPSVVASLPGRYREPQLSLTVVFHPRTSRIGEIAVVPRNDSRAPWILGRRSPGFCHPGEAAGRPLDDPHVSRQALELAYDGEEVMISRLAASSRCRVAGRELQDSVQLEPARLREGVPLLLGHSVVLLLRLGECSDNDAAGRDRNGLLVGGSAYMRDLRRQIAQAAASDVDVLIRGETGTGKELVAVSVHAASDRADADLVSVNMAAIPADLAAAALFGSARGAFTGAHKAAEGYFRQARGGTLFLDEIGDTPPSIQPQLLRALQQREIQSVGGPVQRVDVRVISATDADLDGEGGDFRAALRHRLAACEISLLPLRQHPEDIGELLLHFLAAAATASGRSALLPQGDDTPVETAAWAELFHSFVSHDWPGNVRELDNFARQLVLASEHHLTVPDNILSALSRRHAGRSAGTASDPAPGPRRRMREVDAVEFQAVLEANRFEAAATARQLGVSRQSVYRRIGDTPGLRLASEIPREELQRVLAQHAGDSAAAALQLRVSHTGLQARLRHLQRE